MREGEECERERANERWAKYPLHLPFHKEGGGDGRRGSLLRLIFTKESIEITKWDLNIISNKPPGYVIGL